MKPVFAFTLHRTVHLSKREFKTLRAVKKGGMFWNQSIRGMVMDELTRKGLIREGNDTTAKLTPDGAEVIRIMDQETSRAPSDRAPSDYFASLNKI